MNQRSKRSRDRKRIQDIGGTAMHTGGHISAQRRTESPNVRVPQKTTGEVPADKLSGVAKASPFFRKLKDIATGTKEEQSEAISKATEKTTKKTQRKSASTKQKQKEEETE